MANKNYHNSVRANCQQSAFWKPVFSTNGLSQRKRGILLLQGPVGPFFSRLQVYLETRGLDVRRVCFNAGDRFFARGMTRFSFGGSLDEWNNWLSEYLSAADIGCIILFGSERPVHKVALAVARQHGIRILSLEEGYIRPGYVTVEEGGNNANSPIAGLLPPDDYDPGEQVAANVVPYRGLNSMCGYGALYYALRTVFQTSREKNVFHRPISVLPDIFLWARNGTRKVFRQHHCFAAIQKLLEHKDGRYFLVPLQVAVDSNMQDAAKGWDTTRLITATLSSFARNPDTDARLVFKVHPLERGHFRHGPLIRAKAEALGIGDRVDVIETGSLGLLARHAAGMITITSTSGLSAIYHGTPLLVIGEAIYANPRLAICANGAPDFDTFWSTRHTASTAARASYISWLIKMSLVPGDFYAADGMKAACEGVFAKLIHGAASHKTATTDARSVAPSAGLRIVANAKLPPQSNHHAVRNLE